VLEWLGYIATELHKGFGPLWNPATAEEMKAATRDLLAKKFDYVQGRMAGDYLMGSDFTAPDAYLFTIAGWLEGDGVDIAQFPQVADHFARVRARPAVARVLAEVAG
jgi:glutathione S-transferase